MRLRRQLLKNNACYIIGRAMVPRGVMIHSTGANNPLAARYVPGNDEIGRNEWNTHWDVYHPGGRVTTPHQYVNRDGDGKCDVCGGRQVAVHAFIGKFADGSVGTVQTLPWDWRAWHCGSGKKGTAMDTHISFEICEDGLDDPTYFAAVYQEAVELTAMLCQQFGLDPLEDGVVICHAEGYQRGVASNHGDVLHWFPRHGKTMDDFRADVAREMGKEEIDMTEESLRELIRDEMAKVKAENAKLPASGWAEKGLAEAVALGITDGTRPQDTATRQEVALMVKAVIYAQ